MDCLSHNDMFHTESINNHNRPLQISTVTACANAPGVVIDLMKVYDHINISDIVRYVELGNTNKGYAEKNQKKKRKNKPNKQFFNQLTLIVYCNIYKKIVNIKIFLSGAIQLTGLKSRLGALNMIKFCEDYINSISASNPGDKVLKFKDEQKLIRYSAPKIVLINSDFTLFSNPKHCINRTELYKIIVNDTKVYASYEPCIYPGVNIKYYYNKCNKLEDGICYCKDKCLGKDKTPYDCKRVTIVVFQSSKVIITGANSHAQLMMAFIWIKKLVFKHIDRIIIT